MNEEFDKQLATAQATLLLKLSNERRIKAEQLAKHEYHALVFDLDSGDYIFAPSGQAAVEPPALQPVNHTLRAAAFSGLPVLNVPPGNIVASAQAEQLPCFGILISDEQPDVLKSALVSFFGEHHRSPFCRPLFLTARLDLLPFFRRFGFAAYFQTDGWYPEDFELLKLRYGMSQVRGLGTGEIIW